MAQRIKIQDGIVIFETGDTTSVNMTVKGQLTTDTLTVGSTVLSGTGGASAIGYTGSLAVAATRNVQDRLRDVISVKDFTTVAGADASGRTIFVPAGTYTSTAVSGAALSGNYYGPGQIITADTNHRGKFFSTIKAAPSSLGTHSSIDTAFNGDLSHSTFQIEHRITGAATLGQPATGYSYTPEAYPFYLYLFNSSGWNQSTSGNDGRTAAAGIRVKVSNAGQGDCVAFNASASVGSGGTLPGATNFLANPAASLFNGDMGAVADGVYLNPYETIINDNGHDVAGIGAVYNFKRTVNTGALGVWWTGVRVQSVGTSPLDSIFSASGQANIGLDLSFLTLQAAGTYVNAAITLKADQRIYMNATATDATGQSRFPSALPNTYLFYSSSLSAFNFVNAGTSVLQVYNNQVVTTQATNLGQGSGLDYIRIVGSGSLTPSVNARGTLGTTDVTLGFTTQNAGAFLFQTNGTVANATQFKITHTASAVNYLQITGSGTGTGPSLSVQGTDTNADLNLASKGTGVVALVSGGSTIVSVSNTGATVTGSFSVTGNPNFGTAGTDYINISGTTGFPQIKAAGASTNITPTYISKGTGAHIFQTAGGTTQFKVVDTASAVNFITATGSATGVGVAFNSQGTDTNIPFIINTKGTGAIALSPGGTTVVTVGTTGLSSTGKVVSSGATGGVGYATGAGAAVTQLTSKATGVTLNNPCGKITTFNDSLAGNTTVLFTVTDSVIAATDVVVVSNASGGTAGAYQVWVDSVAAGSCVIAIRNITAGALAEALVLNLSVIKAVAA